jgi:hypothetical protein
MLPDAASARVTLVVVVVPLSKEVSGDPLAGDDDADRIKVGELAVLGGLFACALLRDAVEVLPGDDLPAGRSRREILGLNAGGTMVFGPTAVAVKVRLHDVQDSSRVIYVVYVWCVKTRFLSRRCVFLSLAGRAFES